MADYADIENSLVTFIADALYPDGINAPSIVGTTCRIFRGWPLPAALNSDLSAGVVNVSVFPWKGSGRVLPPLPIVYRVNVALPALSAVVSDETVTFTGMPAVGQCAGLLIDGTSYVYRPQAGDSSALVAAAFAVLVNSDRIALLSGTTLTLPGASRVIGRVVADTVSLTEVRRQERETSITCWCATPDIRDTVAEAIDVALARVTFLPLVEGSSVRVRYCDSVQHDQSQNALLYRRDLIYTVEYPTVVRQTEPAMLFGDLKMGAVQTIV
ncbi:MAG: hypothetical protein P4L71_08475 [Acetobacteraceae bacterium]|nr:hypothetical protein [Acetobacteraceae bacterium]